jgi:environmental stress-induced protein Ves
MSARVLQPPFRPMPWKNGLGTTLELATDAAAPGGAWTWRLSIADVPSRAEFSRFDGLDRSLALLEGDGMRLRATGAEQWMSVPSEGPGHAFRGEDALEGEPVGAGVRDINLFFARSAWRGAMRVVRGESPALSLRADVAIAYLHSTAQPLRVEADGAAITLGPQTLVIASWIALPATTAGSTTIVLARLERARVALMSGG